MRLLRLLVFGSLFLAGLTACAGDDREADATQGTVTTVTVIFEDPVFFGKQWPETIPSDIPALEGAITTVLAGDTKLRLFYNGISDADFMDYVELLVTSGFELEYLIYETPGSEARTVEQAAAGEWDAVCATKGDYELHLEFGAGTGTLDITGIPLEGFESVAAPTTLSTTTAPVGSALPEWLPPVPGGELITATGDAAAGFTAVVVIADGYTVAGYVDVLEAVGFTESDTMLGGYVLSNGEHTITIYGADSELRPLQIMIHAS